MEKKNLTDVLSNKLFVIPDYQRGYAWEEKQWKDFAQDIDALIDDKIVSHYTGTIVIYQPIDRPTAQYGTKKLELVDVVDGQQRLTTCSLYLSIILNKLIESGEKDFELEIPNYIFSGATSKLRLNNETSDFFLDLLTTGVPNVNPNNVHQKRLFDAYNYFCEYLSLQKDKRKEDFSIYLQDLFDAIIRKLSFSLYPIEIESEIGMTFELMNSRGKNLSVMELLKNYFMYWVYRNTSPEDKEDMTKTINKTWKEVYSNIAKCNGNESQCLRIAWTLYNNHLPKNWKGYEGFKGNNVVPLRDFNLKSKDNTKHFIMDITKGLSEISNHYSEILNPTENSERKEEYEWLMKIKNAGNIANFLPLMIATRIKYKKNQIEYSDYIDLLISLEKFSFRVFLWKAKRSNTGLSSFYRWGNEVFNGKFKVKEVIEWIYGLLNYHSEENNYRKELPTISNWYARRRLLKYSLYEYELWLLKREGKNAVSKINWNDLTDSTIEHILPQTPAEASEWKKIWKQNEINLYLHDISNLVLTKDNSNYLNFDFDRKKGQPGVGHCYSNSDIRQERKIAEFKVWNVDSCNKRKETLVAWFIERWGVDTNYKLPEGINEEDDVEVEDDLQSK